MPNDVPDCDAVQTILARLPKTMHGSCERMDGRLQRDTRVYYWQQTGAPAPNGPGARTSRDRTVRPQPEGFATTLCSPILEERFAVCGGEEIAVDRWYHHLLVFLLVFLLLLVYHSLLKSRPARSCARFALCVRSTHTYLRTLILRSLLRVSEVAEHLEGVLWPK